MKIKHLSIFAAAAMMFGFSSCSSDEPTDLTPSGNGDNVYARIQLYFPSRSVTDIDDPNDYNGTDNSSDGYEIGLEHENRVNDVLVVLATDEDNTGNYKKIAVGKSSAMPATPFDEKNPVFTLTFREDAIQRCADKRVYIFAYCNAGGYINENDVFDIDKILTITSADLDQGIWKRGSILMANAPNTTIPSKLLPPESDLITKYNSPEKALDLGTVDVARVVSRFDFKSINNNEYPIYQYIADPDDHDKLIEDQIATVKLLSMAPLNIAKEFYVLPRVSDDGTDNNWKLCGTEYFNLAGNVNYVVSPNFALKNDPNLSNTLLNKYFYQSTGADDYSDDNFDFTPISQVVSGEDDNDAEWHDTPLTAEDKEGYKIYRYVTENTLPAISSQKKGISTGIIFKAEITNAKEGTPLAEGMKSKHNIYSFNGTIYGDLAMLRSTVYSLNETNALRVAFTKVFPASYLSTEKNEDGSIKLDENNNIVWTVSDANLQDCTDVKNLYDNINKLRYFKIYRATTEKDNSVHYYVYYTYYNRHNDNHNSVDMGAMEFGTVRNNIYKLYVSSISELGYTRPEELPDDPDEEPKTYLKVSCRVVPWMVRVNKIEF
ncbi:MAG: Mfa1 family fimbria major subunit [Muribaculaceae bacterium]|nr:Mfa1 family fimbria major subunit [Muribaculaceae bacterium]